MLIISKKSHYGIQALLTLAEHYEKGLLQIKDIVADTRIPKQYLEQIFNRLVKAGIVKSVRGKNGGYQLASSPDQLTVLHFVEVLEGSMEIPSDMTGPDDAIGELFSEAGACLRKKLDIPFTNLLERQQELRKSTMYFI